MNHLIQKTGISQDELLYHLYRGLKEVNRILKKKYPEQPQLKEATFTFTLENENTSGLDVSFIIGIKKVKTKKYIQSDSVTVDLSNISAYTYKPSKFEWKEFNIGIQYDFAGSLLRRVSKFILLSRKNNSIKNKKISIKDSFSIIQIEGVFLKLALKEDLININGNVSLKNTITHDFEVILELEPPKEEVSPILVSK